MDSQETLSELVNKRVDVTSWDDPISMHYHMKQWGEPKESTKAFLHFFSNEIANSKCLVDIGAGAGAATYFLAVRNHETKFIGLDSSEELIAIAKEMSKEFDSVNLTFEFGDWFSLEEKWMGVDGVISLQTLSWLPEMRKPMTQIFEVIKPNWIGLSSLFYEGDISCKVEVYEHSRSRKTYYNVYSLKELERLANEYGYRLVKFGRFDIGVDLPKPKSNDVMGTFTERVLEDSESRRLQISGPLLMNWYFVLLEKM